MGETTRINGVWPAAVGGRICRCREGRLKRRRAVFAAPHFVAGVCLASVDRTYPGWDCTWIVFGRSRKGIAAMLRVISSRFQGDPSISIVSSSAIFATNSPARTSAASGPWVR